MQSQRKGRRYLAGLVILALVFMAVGTLGPAHRSPYYPVIVVLPGLAVLLLGWRAWSSADRSVALSAIALVLLLLVLIFSHFLPRAVG
jgi:heme O synthase-like polyprenyltransferase